MSSLPLFENRLSYIHDVTKFYDGMHWKSRIQSMQNCMTHTCFWCKIIRIQLLHKIIISILWDILMDPSIQTECYQLYWLLRIWFLRTYGSCVQLQLTSLPSPKHLTGAPVRSGQPRVPQQVMTAGDRSSHLEPSSGRLPYCIYTEHRGSIRTCATTGSKNTSN